MEYTEHAKLHKIAEQSQWLGEFLEWMGENGYLIHKYEKKDEEDDDLTFLCRQYKSVNQWLAEYFNIDLKKIDKEKKQILDEMRELNKQFKGGASAKL